MTPSTLRFLVEWNSKNRTSAFAVLRSEQVGYSLASVLLTSSMWTCANYLQAPLNKYDVGTFVQGNSHDPDGRVQPAGNSSPTCQDRNWPSTTLWRLRLPMTATTSTMMRSCGPTRCTVYARLATGPLSGSFAASHRMIYSLQGNRYQQRKRRLKFQPALPMQGSERSARVHNSR